MWTYIPEYLRYIWAYVQLLWAITVGQWIRPKKPRRQDDE